jgi:hypothetical protein
MHCELQILLLSYFAFSSPDIIACPNYFSLTRKEVDYSADQSKARVCDRSLAGVTGSNPAGAIDVYLL